ncbi:MAG: branched-chain amino acid ABC transporter ATP-binding protein [Anaerolineae bacterium CG2_30_64_16]|nr:MAG: branched-chain amino acid ABC transporter ATP-binding protein [Anaerolineae bacterium CG2_30_64_16]
MKEAMRVTDLNAGYGKIPVLRDVSFHVGDGEVVTVIGPNGAGKSTLLKTLSGLVHPHSGSVRFEGQELAGKAPHLVMKAGIAHVPEGGRLFINMSVADNLLMGAYRNRASLKTGVLDEIYAMFPVLRERQGQLAGTLSGGEKQMLAIGRGLASRPRFLMLDEPSLGLAPKLVDSIYERLQLLRESGLAVLLVEQNTTYALELADRGYVLENGRIVLEGGGAELARSEHIKKHYLGL